MNKKANKAPGAEEPKRIFKEDIDIEAPKTPEEIARDQARLQELLMKKFRHENAIEKAKTELQNMKYEMNRAARDAESTTKKECVEAIVKVYAGSMKKEYYINDVLHHTEEADRWDLQADIDDLNYVEEEEEGQN